MTAEAPISLQANDFQLFDIPEQFKVDSAPHQSTLEGVASANPSR